MKIKSRIFAFLSGTIFLCAGAFAAVGNIAPDFTLSTPDGTEVTLSSEVQQQTTVLYFWATWCPYCKALKPHLQSIQTDYGDDVKILAINIREDGDPVGYLKEAGFDFTLLLDGDEVADTLDVYATPGVLVIDSEQRIRFNLYELPLVEPPDAGENPSHTTRAAHKAPFWATEIRKVIDELAAE